MSSDAALSSRLASGLPHARTVVQSPHGVCGARQRLPRCRPEPVPVPKISAVVDVVVVSPWFDDVSRV